MEIITWQLNKKETQMYRGTCRTTMAHCVIREEYSGINKTGAIIIITC